MHGRWNPATSLFAGMSSDVLTAALASAQQAYIDLTSGGKPEAAAYTQGDGSKSVTFTRANLGQLTMLIRQLQAQLGIIERPRRAIGVRF